MIYLLLRNNGLGNQMFSYAFARRLLCDYEKEGIIEQVCINRYGFRIGADANHIAREYSLNHFRLSNDVKVLSDFEEKDNYDHAKEQFRKSNGYGRIIASKFHLLQLDTEDAYYRRSKRGVYYSYRAHKYYDYCLSNTKDKYVIGYYQNERYFRGMETILKRDFEIVTPLNMKNTLFLESITSCDSVCVHIRRGDYLDPYWKKLNICNESYYIKAFQTISERIQNPVYYIFSNTPDDLAWIKKNYLFLDKYRVEFVNSMNPDYDELRLMKHCKHFIISNSTFSWWAAYLADNPNKIICCPSRWDLNIPGDAGMNSELWIPIDVSTIT